MIPFHPGNHFLNLGKNILSLSEFDSVFYILELNSDTKKYNSKFRKQFRNLQNLILSERNTRTDPVP